MTASLTNISIDQVVSKTPFNWNLFMFFVAFRWFYKYLYVPNEHENYSIETIKMMDNEWLNDSWSYDLKHRCKRCLTFISISSVFIESEWYGFVWAKYFMKIPLIILIWFFLLSILPQKIIEMNNSGGFFLRIELCLLSIAIKIIQWLSHWLSMFRNTI